MESFGVMLSNGDKSRVDGVVVILSDIVNVLNNQKGGKLLNKYQPVMKQLLQALSGTDFNLIREAEYYSDLKETLKKIHHNILQASKRKLIARLVMASRQTQSVEEIQGVVDRLCGRIFLSYAQRRLMKKNSTDL